MIGPLYRFQSNAANAIKRRVVFRVEPLNGRFVPMGYRSTTGQEKLKVNLFARDRISERIAIYIAFESSLVNERADKRLHILLTLPSVLVEQLGRNGSRVVRELGSHQQCFYLLC